MARPSSKSPEIAAYLERIRGRTTCIKSDACHDHHDVPETDCESCDEREAARDLTADILREETQ